MTLNSLSATISPQPAGSEHTETGCAQPSSEGDFDSLIQKAAAKPQIQGRATKGRASRSAKSPATSVEDQDSDEQQQTAVTENPQRPDQSQAIPLITALANAVIFQPAPPCQIAPEVAKGSEFPLETVDAANPQAAPPANTTAPDSETTEAAPALPEPSTPAATPLRGATPSSKTASPETRASVDKEHPPVSRPSDELETPARPIRSARISEKHPRQDKVASTRPVTPLLSEVEIDTPNFSTGESDFTSPPSAFQESAIPRSPAVSSTQSPPDASMVSPRGMSAALHKNAMHKTHEVDENSCRTGQVLPDGGVATDSSPPARPDRKSSATGETSASSPAAIETPGTATPSAPRETTVVADAPNAQATPGHAVARSIENAVARLQHTSVTSMAVVLKPDANTQLSLHLKMDRGRIEAIAVLERGQFDSINSEWTQLQGRLSDHGVRLAPLVATSRDEASGGGDFSSSPQHRDRPSPAEVPVLEATKSPARKSRTPAVHSTAKREWWA